ncbi:UDP-glucose 4-epimerase GalE [bacterium]|jgi:UDP-glucose 4-epimerase|nr:UDP-glucose 4-epimerase GalE [bacterium]
MQNSILITGAAGYIGSHVAEALLLDPHAPDAEGAARAPRLVLVDDLSTGHRELIDVIQQTARERGLPEPVFHKVSLLDHEELERILIEEHPSAVVHFAALIAVGESVQKPGLYFRNNVDGSICLLSAMRKAGVKNLVFSSTAAVYGTRGPAQATTPLKETDPLGPGNPYGETKLRMEQEIVRAGTEWGLQSVIFRYFNAAGAGASGRLGEWHEPETHLIPLLLRAARSGRPLQVYGTDYATRDGSGIRDYIHVSDLADAHLRGLDRLLSGPGPGASIYNLGTEQGTSVLEVIRAAEEVLGMKVPYEIHSRRAGDAEVLIADASKAFRELGWRPAHSSIQEILKTAWAWERVLTSKPRP